MHKLILSCFSVFYLFLFSVTIIMQALFRSIAAACKSEAPAHTIAGISILALGLCFFLRYSVAGFDMYMSLRNHHGLAINS